MKLGGFASLRNNDRSDIPYFSVKEEDGVLREAARQREYKKYRAQYKTVRGVFPELDRLNNPPVAICADDAFWPEDAEHGNVRGLRRQMGSVLKDSASSAFDGTFSGALGGMLGGMLGAGITAMQHDPANVEAFLKMFSTIVADQKYLYSLAASNDFIPDYDSLESGEKIENNLGYRFNANNGLYEEGTFQDGELIYGMMILNGEIALFGDVRNGEISEGILRTSDSLDCGVFGEDGLTCENGFRWSISKDEEGNLRGGIIVGKFVEGIADGFCYIHDLESGATLKQKYEDGGAVTGIKSMWENSKEAKRQHKEKVKEMGHIGAYIDDQKKAAKAVLDVFNPFAGRKKR